MNSLKNYTPLPGDYVLATKYKDGSPGDHWAVGIYTGMLPKKGGDRYLVSDSEGTQFRGNGFRKVYKITFWEGQWILEHRDEIEAGYHNLWWWLVKSRKKLGILPEEKQTTLGDLEKSVNELHEAALKLVESRKRK